MTTTTPTEDLLLAQYDSLRKEIDQKIQALESLATYGVVGTAVVWTWIVTHKTDLSSKVVLFVPLVASLLFLFKAHALRDGIIRLSEHLIGVEEHFSLDDKLGWERRCKKRRDEGRSDLLGRWEGLFWALVSLINALAPFVFGLI